MSGSAHRRSLLLRLLKAVRGSPELLAPRAAACLLCGKPRALGGAKQNPKLPAQLRQSLCGACLSAIPWIDRISCRKCGRGVHCGDCLRQPHISFVCNRSAVHYDKAMRGLLAQYKYRGNEQLAPIIGSMLLPAYERLTAEITPTKSRWRLSGRSAPIWNAITYVPISPERAMERGFNQAEQLASQLALYTGVPLFHLLQRSRHTEKQSFKSRTERMRNTRQLFHASGDEMLRLYDRAKASSASQSAKNRQPIETPLRVLLIDDIYTTGSTAEECAAALHRKPASTLEIYVLTWARS
jgi:competence protein ComFC